MKLSKKYNLIPWLAACLFSVTTAVGQSPDSLQTASPLEQATTIASRLERDLSLTSEQTTQVLEVVKSRFSAIAQDKKAKRLTGEGLEKLNQETRQQLARILTREQYALYLELRQQTAKQKEEYAAKHPKYTYSEQDKEMDF